MSGTYSSHGFEESQVYGQKRAGTHSSGAVRAVVQQGTMYHGPKIRTPPSPKARARKIRGARNRLLSSTLRAVAASPVSSAFLAASKQKTARDPWHMEGCSRYVRT